MGAFMMLNKTRKEADRKIKLAKESKCPFCKSDATTYQALEVVGAGQVEQWVECGDCSKEWVEVYLLGNVCELRRNEELAAVKNA